MTDQEIIEMLTKIFPPKPEPPATSINELPSDMQNVVMAAVALGLPASEIPPIVLLETSSEHTGAVVYNKYNCRTIEIAKEYGYIFKSARTDRQQALTLAHELGHIEHCYRVYNSGGDYIKDISFKEQEDTADEFVNKVAEFLGWPERR